VTVVLRHPLAAQASLQIATRIALCKNRRVQPTFADPKTDFIFKRIFGADARKSLLIALLNHLLELVGDQQILDVEHLPTEQHVDVVGMKNSVVDVKCTDASGRRFVVEMQILKVEGFEKRVVYNACKAFVMQLRSGDKYPALCDVIGITICNFMLWPETISAGNFEIPMLSRWRMQEQHSGALRLSQLQHVFLELPKYAAGNTPATLVEKWAYFFREAGNLEFVPPTLSASPFAEAMEVARATAYSKDDWEAYNQAKMAEQDAKGALSLARKEGKAEGEAKGRAEGKVEGKVETLLQILQARGLEVSSAQRAQIESCGDPKTRATWIERALVAATSGELFEPS
jgi:predicted transposase/invertase (TIGR01784 family)